MECLTPVLRACSRFPNWPPHSNAHWTPELCLQNPRNHARSPRRVGPADELNHPRKTRMDPAFRRLDRADLLPLGGGVCPVSQGSQRRVDPSGRTGRAGHRSVSDSPGRQPQIGREHLETPAKGPRHGTGQARGLSYECGNPHGTFLVFRCLIGCGWIEFALD